MKRYYRKTTCLVSLALLAFLSSERGNQANSQASTTTAQMSYKQLLNKADEDFAARRLEEARDAIIRALAMKANKPNKKYDPILDQINATLADREAAKGETACSRQDLATCELQIMAAKKFASTPKVNAVEAHFSQLLSEITQKQASFVKEAESGKSVDALSNLSSLKKFAAYLPSLEADLTRVKKLAVNELLSEGKGLVDSRNWDGATVRFQRALDLDSENTTAKTGLETIERGKKGYGYFNEAMSRLSDKKFAGSLKAINLAIESYPEGKEFQQGKQDITRAWATYLLQELPGLITPPNNLKRTRQAYLNLELVLALDPANQEVAKYVKEVQSRFGSDCLQQATEQAQIGVYSYIASALLAKLNALRLLDPGTVPQEELKDLATNFNRKRACQVVLSVEDVSGGASSKFLQAVRDLSRSSLDNLGLPDMKIRDLTDYLKSPNEDAQFQDLRPDGKSSTLFLKVEIRKYETERKASENLIQKKSSYISGTEMLPNPEYKKRSEELDHIRRALENPNRKKDKPTPEGYTPLLYDQKKLELDKTPSTISHDKVTDYTYQEIPYKQHTTLQLNIMLRDYFSKDEVASDAIRVHDEREDVQVDGVQDRDLNGLKNRLPRILPPEQVLRDAERSTLESLNGKLPKLLLFYTLRFYREGEKAAKAMRTEDAIESLICHWTFFRGKLDPEQKEWVTEMVRSETGFDFAKQGPDLLSLMVSTSSAGQVQ